MAAEQSQNELTTTIHLGLREVSDPTQKHLEEQLALLSPEDRAVVTEIQNSAGEKVVAGKVCGEVESTKSVSEIYAPVTGTVVAINDSLSNSPETINSDPYGAGWLAKIEVQAAPGDLLTAAQYGEITA